DARYRGRVWSKSARPNPEAFLPQAARRNALQLLVQAAVRHVERVRDGRHRLEADEALRLSRAAAAGGRRRVHDSGAIVRPEEDIDPLRASLHRDERTAGCVADEIAKHIVEAEVAKCDLRGIRGEPIDWSRLTGWDLVGRQHPLRTGAKRDDPFVARRIGQLEVRMEAYR